MPTISGGVSDLTGAVLVTGAAPLTGDWDIGNGRMIQADKVRARDGDGLSLFEDGGTGIFVEDGGNVGIKTTTPSAVLHVTDAGTPENAVLKITQDDGNVYALLIENTADGNSGLGVILDDYGNTTIKNRTSNDDLTIQTSSYSTQLFLDGGTGLVGISAATPAGKLHVDQSSSSGAVPVLYLDQADVSEEMIEFATTIGVGNAIEAVGAKTLTTTHFIKVTLPGALTRYIPCGTIA